MNGYNWIGILVLFFNNILYSQNIVTYTRIDSLYLGEDEREKVVVEEKGWFINGKKEGLSYTYSKLDTSIVRIKKYKKNWLIYNQTFYPFATITELSDKENKSVFIDNSNEYVSHNILFRDIALSETYGLRVGFQKEMSFDNEISHYSPQSINRNINTTWWFDISKGEFVAGNGPSYDMILLDTTKVVANSIETVAIPMKIGYDKKDSISTIAKGHLINGLREGKFKLYSATTNHLLKEQSYHKGIPTGQFMQFYENGNIYSIGTQTEEYTVIHFLDKKERYSKTIYYPMHKKEASIEITYNKMPVFEYKIYGITQKKCYFDKAKNNFVTIKR